MQPFVSPLNLDEVPDDVAALYSEYEAHFGGVPPLLKILGRRPSFAALFHQIRMAEKQVSDQIEIADQLLIGAKLAALSHSPYAMRAILERNTMYQVYPESKINAIFNHHATENVFTDREHLMLELAERVHLGTMDQRFWSRLKENFSDNDILDLIVIASNQQWFAAMSRALGLTSLDMMDLPNGPSD